MDPAIPLPNRKLTFDEFVDWCRAHPEAGRCELVDGEIVSMAAESLRHVRIKQQMWLALRNAVAAAELPCEVLMDGAAVLVDDLTSYEPDVTLACGERGEDAALVVPEPLLVVEVVSKSSRGRDAGAKLTDYFRVPSIVHYLLVDMHKPVVIHHRRRPDETIETRIVREGALHLDPPGLTVDIAACFPPPD
ncbi:MAG: Uma2 family endonuclease [Alphaproteobacteria bacterium]|jgi:Uma2 family endonuclease|nr:Uma2 family endonuclease [Alphaproteobacteria bacterium]